MELVVIGQDCEVVDLKPLVVVMVLFAVTSVSAGVAGEWLPTEIRSEIERRFDEHAYTGLVIGMVDARGVRYASFGSTFDGGPAVHEHTIFEVGSVTKVLTGTLLAELVRHGVVTYDDTVAGLLPDGVFVAPDVGAITLRQLATHHSGLPRLPNGFRPSDPANPYADFDDRALLEFLSQQPLMRPPGQAYEYSNFGSALLGYLLSRAAGQDYETLVHDLILTPLGMSDTVLRVPAEERQRFAYGHEGGAVVAHWDFDAFAPCGAYRSTAEDLLRLAAAHLFGMDHEMHQSLAATTLEPLPTAAPAMMVTAGWHVVELPAARLTTHDGGTFGAKSLLGFRDDTGVGVVVLANSSYDVTDLAFRLLVPDFPLSPIRPSVALSERDLDRLVGRYRFENGPAMTVSRRPGGLLVRIDGQQPLGVWAETPLRFFYRAGAAELEFIGADDTVVAVEMLVGSSRQRANRVEP